MTSTIDTQTLSAEDTATFLRIKLGAVRAWGKMLSKTINSGKGYAGFQLLPCCRQEHAGFQRPRYALPDITEFVEGVLAAVPEAGKTPLTPVILAINPALHWKLNNFDQDGKPIRTTPTRYTH